MRATNIRNGNIIKFNGKYCKVREFHHHTPGNLRAFVQAKMVDIMTGTTFDHRFRAEDDVEIATVESVKATYLYDEGDFYVFMDSETYEQHQLAKAVGEEVAPYLKENEEVTINFIEGSPVGIEVAMTMEFEVVETEPHLKGATANSSNKPAVLDNGVTISVPPYIEVGTRVRVDTRTNSFIERV